MIPIICVDDHWGMAFAGRRQSADRAVRADMLAEAAGSRLWMNGYSRRQFDESGKAELLTAEDFLDRAGPGEFCLVEDRPLLPWLDRMEGLVLYRWNRRYPADVCLDIRPEPPGWRLVRREEFAGSSHPCITKEVYQR